MSTTRGRRQVYRPLLISLALIGAVGAFYIFLASGLADPDGLMAVAALAHRPGAESTIAVYFCGQELYTRSSLNPNEIYAEYVLWDIGPGLIAVVGGAVLGALAAYLISQWLFRRTAPIGGVLLILSQERACNSNAIISPNSANRESSD